MKIDVREEGGAKILAGSGKLNIDGADVLRQAVRDAASGGGGKVVLDFTGVTTMDSSGLGELVRAKTIFDQASIAVRLVLDRQSKVEQVLEMTRLDRVFDTYYELSEALSE